MLRGCNDMKGGSVIGRDVFMNLVGKRVRREFEAKRAQTREL